MKKLLIFALILVIAQPFAWAKKGRDSTPKVRYIEPKSESLVDLTDEEVLTFKWKPTPIPGGGRMAYKFELFKEFGYDRIVNETLRERVFSIDIPADRFADGALYTWQVRQRDASTPIWSMDQRWSFTVKK